MYTSLLRKAAVATAGMLLFGSVAQAQSWPQWALNAQHMGQVSVTGQPLNRILASIVFDPLVPAEMAANQGDLLAHYQVPLIGPDVEFHQRLGGAGIAGRLLAPNGLMRLMTAPVVVSSLNRVPPAPGT